MVHVAEELLLLYGLYEAIAIICTNTANLKSLVSKKKRPDQ